MKITSNLDKVIEDVDRIIHELEAAENDILDEMGLMVENQAMDNVRSEFQTKWGLSKVNVNTGNLAAKWTRRVEDHKIIVASGVKYAYNVEYGTRPGTWVPFNDLRQWFIRKKKIPLKKRETVDSIVSRIQKKIYLKGILPSPFLRPAPYQQSENIKAMIQRRIDEKIK